MIVPSDESVEARPLQLYPNGSQVQNPMSVVAVSASQTQFKFTLRDYGVTIFIKKNVYHEYNFVLNQYNQDENRIGDIYMCKLKNLCFVRNITCHGCCYWFIFSVSFGTSVPLFIYNLIRFITLINIVNTMKYNRRNVPNVFEKMIYCKTLQKNNCYLEISSSFYTQNIQVLGISYESFALAYSRIANTSGSFTVRVMFYNDKFVDHYTQAPGYVCLDICLTSILLFLSLISAIISIYVSLNTLFQKI